MSGSLDHSPADILRRTLIGLSLGTLPTDSGTWPIFTNLEPTTPDNCVTTYDTAGVHQGRFQVDGQVQERHGFQVRIRGTSFTTVWTKARAIAVALDESIYLYSLTISASDYLVHAVTRLSGPINLGQEADTSKRNVMTINGTVALKKV